MCRRTASSTLRVSNVQYTHHALYSTTLYIHAEHSQNLASALGTFPNRNIHVALRDVDAQVSLAGDWNLQDWKMTNWKMEDNQKTGVENAGLENDGQENVGLRQYGLALRCLEYILLTASLLL